MNHASRELMLYVENNYAFINSISKNIKRKLDKGDFIYEKGLNALDRYCLISAAKQYHLEHGSMTDSWNDIFPKHVRMETAEYILERLIAAHRIYLSL